MEKQVYSVTVSFKDGSNKVMQSYNPAPNQLLNMYVFEETDGSRHVITIDKIRDIEIKPV